MKAISLWQPWASLVVTGIKQYETRSWKPPENILGTRVAIHATQRWDEKLQRFTKTLEKRYPEEFELLHLIWKFYPLGAVVGTVIVQGWETTEEAREYVTGMEQNLGDYSDNRFAWKLIEPIGFNVPILCRGYQRIWSWNND
jgi:hypothetical protein